MSKPHVLITSFMLKPGDETDQYLTSSGIEVVWNKWHGGRTEEEMKQILQGIDGTIASIDPFTNQVFDAAPQLKVVSRTGVGYDAVDVPAATAHKVAVCITPGTNNVAVAEYAFAFMIGKARKLIENHNEVMNGGWTRHVGG